MTLLSAVLVSSVLLYNCCSGFAHLSQIYHFCCRLSMTVLSAMLVFSVLLFLAAMRIARTAPDYRPAEGSSGA